jgi:hypothetical protein
MRLVKSFTISLSLSQKRSTVLSFSQKHCHDCCLCWIQMLGWLVAAPVVLAVLYTVFVPCFKYLVGRFGGIPSSPRTPMKVV